MSYNRKPVDHHWWQFLSWNTLSQFKGMIRLSVPVCLALQCNLLLPFQSTEVLHDLSYFLNCQYSLKKWPLQWMINLAFLSPAITVKSVRNLLGSVKGLLHFFSIVHEIKRNFFNVALEISHTESTKMACR